MVVIGTVARDATGEILSSSARRIRNIESILYAELLAILEGLRRAFEDGHNK